MTRARRQHTLPLLALLASFAAGVLVDGWLRTYGPPKPVQTAPKPVAAAPGPVVAAAPPPAMKPLAAPAPDQPPTIEAVPGVPAGTVPAARLRMPIDGIRIETFNGDFSKVRGSHSHEAVDILSPRGTPIHAVSDGTIAKLFFSKAGGITIYEFDPEGRLCFYYAHLERYADGLHENQRVSRGEVIGYVGTSGNAPLDTPHLHFAVFELDADRRWWQGRALDPYTVFKEKGE